jgi:tRNA-uridine 2-sulfurtransferase
MATFRSNKQKAAVALSGGVDSSVAAMLLKNKGFEVVGVFMHFWKEQSSLEDIYHKIENKCCSLSAEESARQIARKLHIPFYVFHFEKEFKKYVVDYFIKEYELGYTPNPCISCNKKIKFDFLFNKVRLLGCNYLATGHYIKNIYRNGEYNLYKAKDKNKDQSYFLYNIKCGQLKNLIFPLGNYFKKDVRKIAQKNNLSTSQRKDSQGICFVMEKNINDFLRRFLKKYKKGNIVDMQGKKIGEHDGLPFYTLGQRKGIKVASQKPYYVADIDYISNKLIVTDNIKDNIMYSEGLEFSEANWLDNKIKFPSEFYAAIRYRHKPVNAVIFKKSKNKFYLKFKNPQWAVMSGQSVVLYDKNRLVGGGIIRKRLKIKNGSHKINNRKNKK